MNQSSLESILLSKDGRCISGLSKFLPSEYCLHAARFLLNHPSRVLITTGFFISKTGLPETDGPPGALAIGESLRKLGHEVAYVSDEFSVPLLSQFSSDSLVHLFPLLEESGSQKFAERLINKFRPTMLISVERCGLTINSRYLDWKGNDVSKYNARIDSLFHFQIPSIGIGDGGNEIGMGTLASVIPTLSSLPEEPCITKTDALVIASVSNWGAYGLVAGLSKLTGIPLLPSDDSEARRIEDMVEYGACDGVELARIPKVDGFSMEDNADILKRLRRWVEIRSVTDVS
jgi:hypothetical protein